MLARIGEGGSMSPGEIMKLPAPAVVAARATRAPANCSGPVNSRMSAAIEKEKEKEFPMGHRLWSALPRLMAGRAGGWRKRRRSLPR